MNTGLLSGIGRDRCILREGVARTDVTYDTSEVGAFTGFSYQLKSDFLTCLQSEKVGRIRRD